RRPSSVVLRRAGAPERAHPPPLMLYHLLTWLNAMFDPPGFAVFQFITVRATLAAAAALLIALFPGERLRVSLRAKQIAETVRATLAAGTALLIALFAGKRLIDWLRVKQIGETIREGEDAGVVSHRHKAGTPTMGGVILLLALGGATLLWGDLTNAYVWAALLATFWMGAFGFADDYIKVVKKDKQGLAEK